MSFHGLQHFISHLEKENELIRIKEYVNPKLEIAEITDRISKSGNNKALLFENTGYSFPVLINAMGSYKRMCIALGVEHLDDIGKEIETLFQNIISPQKGFFNKIQLLPTLYNLSSWMPKTIQGRGKCQEVIMKEADTTKLPVMTCWPYDGGPFMTLPIVHTKDPHTDTRNVGLYRMQVFGPKLTAMHWHKHKNAAGHWSEYKKCGKQMPVAVALGGDPVYTYAASAPLPPNVDEYIFAGFLRKKSVELVKCITQDIEVPADADFILEGYIDTEEALILEGPFGDHTGYYSLADYYPKFHITCITHKKEAVYPSTIVGIPPQEDAWIGKATERIFLTPIKMTLLPEIADINMPVEGVFHNIVIVKIKKEFEGHAQKVMNALWGAGQMMLNKLLIITNEDIDIQNHQQVAQLLATHVNPATDIYFSQGPMDVLDHSCSKFAFGGKMCINATTPINTLINWNEIQIDKENIQTLFPDIVAINDSLLKEKIPCVFIFINKNKKNHIKELNEQLFKLKDFVSIKMVVYMDVRMQKAEIADCIWTTANNIDAKRDCFIIQKNATVSHIGIDGTRKTKQFDDFNRGWPNIICMDDETIQRIDNKWETLGLGKLISSPSLKYRNYVLNGNAVVKE